MDKPNLYWLTNHEYYLEKVVLVDKLSDEKYRVLEFGKFKPILQSGILVDTRIAEILSKYVPDQIDSVNKVTIWRKSTDETWNNYSKIEIKHNLNLENFKSAKYDGFRIYLLMFNEIYISSALKEKLIAEYEKINELDFINEWPKYAG